MEKYFEVIKTKIQHINIDAMQLNNAQKKNDYIKEEERSYISNLHFHHKKLQKQCKAKQRN